MAYDAIHHVAGECGFPDTGAGGDDYQLPFLQASGYAVKVGAAGGQSGQASATLAAIVRVFDYLPENVLQGAGVSSRLVQGAQHGGLGSGGDLGGSTPSRVAAIGLHGDGGGLQLSQHRILADDLGIAGDVGSARGRVGYFAKVGQASTFVRYV